MSEGAVCHCAEKEKPIAERAWVVIQRNSNQSAFNGYRWTRSDYSAIFCRYCRSVWRTKARYVNKLQDGEIK